MHKPNKKIKEVQKQEVDTADLVSEELEICWEKRSNLA